MHEPCLLHRSRHPSQSLPHLAILSIGVVHHPIRTTRVFNSFFSFLSSRPSIVRRLRRCLSLSLLLSFFLFYSFSRGNNEMWRNGSSLLKSEHRSLLCFLFPFRWRGRRKMAFREYTLTGMEISLPLFFFFFILGRCFAFPFPFFLPFLSFVRSLLRSSLYFYSNRLSTSAFPVFFVLYYASWAYSLHFGLAMRRVEWKVADKSDFFFFFFFFFFKGNNFWIWLYLYILSLCFSLSFKYL